jgi:peptidase E
MPTKQIIAFGGGQLFMEPQNPLLIKYLLAQAGRRKSPRITYVATASGDLERFLLGFYSRFANLGATLTHLPFFDRVPELREHVMRQDIVLVGGGNVKSMMAAWGGWGFVEVLREAYEGGIVLAGLSAGAICWFDQALADSYASGLRVVPCLGLLPGSCCPHYDGEKLRRPAFQAAVASGEAGSGIGIDDAAAVHFVDGRLERVVASIEGSGAYAVRQSGKASRETRLPVELLA